MEWVAAREGGAMCSGRGVIWSSGGVVVEGEEGCHVA